MKILVTGGAGFIGSNFIRYILNTQNNVKILNCDKLTYSGNLENLKDKKGDHRLKFIKGDIANFKHLYKVIKDFKPEYIINFAAETHVDKSIHEERQDFLKTNTIGVYNILEILKKLPVKKYVQVSTDEVYGSLPLNSSKKFTEEFPLTPNSPYAASKASGDIFCKAYFVTFGIPVTIARCGNNFGPYQYPEKLIPYFILKMIENKKLPLYGDGKNIRDWVYVLDYCRALKLCLFKGDPGEIYNIGAGNELSNLEIANLILKYFRRNKNWIEFVLDRPGHDRRYALNSSKIRKQLGWRPKYSFASAFKKTINWYLKNRKWIKNILKKGHIINPHIH